MLVAACELAGRAGLYISMSFRLQVPISIVLDCPTIADVTAPHGSGRYNNENSCLNYDNNSFAPDFSFY